MNTRILAIALMTIGFTLIFVGMTLITYMERANGSLDVG
jgi:uncharacterized membrane protein